MARDTVQYEDHRINPQYYKKNMQIKSNTICIGLMRKSNTPMEEIKELNK